jgi:acyl-CoA thioesterase-1
MSHNISSVPVESLTDLLTCSTEIIESDMNPSLYRRDCIARSVLALCALSSGTGTFAMAPSAPVLLVLGDSLSAEYGLKRGSGWVALLERRLAEAGFVGKVVNASISGDTTSGGRSRLPDLLEKYRPRLVMIELGANDALRGLPLAMTHANLLAMTNAAKLAGSSVILIGMQIPPNYGRDYADRFAATFAEVAKAGKAELVPFLLKDIADSKDAEHYFQNDRIHPNETAHPTILNNVWPTVRKLMP